MKTKMATDTLYAVGWRQGTVLKAQIDVVATTTDGRSGKPSQIVRRHDYWVVVTQDCTLDRTRISSNAPEIELRQVHDSQPPTHWGIHARKFLIDAEKKRYLIDGKPSLFVTPRLLCSSDVTELLYTLPDHRLLALKTWLGNRYDRPAVPPDLIPLARAIANVVGSDTRRSVGGVVREVYMAFGGTEEEKTFSLYAVTTPEADPGIVREWLAEGALEIPPELGTPEHLEVGTAQETSLALIESTYCADLSQITWSDDEYPDGAF